MTPKVLTHKPAREAQDPDPNEWRTVATTGLTPMLQQNTRLAKVETDTGAHAKKIADIETLNRKRQQETEKSAKQSDKTLAQLSLMLKNQEESARRSVEDQRN